MAPFKLRFSKMSKSRSNGSKGSRSNSVECDEPGQQCQPNNSNTQALASCNSRPETPAAEGSAAGFPDSPPPSYQHVLEETRLKRSTTNNTEEDVEEEDEEEEYDGDSSRERTKNQRQESSAEEMNNQRRNKSADIQRSSAGGAGCPGGGGGGGEGRMPVKPPEIIHKSSKELYKAVAKQWGITCKMSDQCRCFDCQSHYFDCDYDNDELQKTDGGLSAGTPMFIAEVIHGTACVLL